LGLRAVAPGVLTGELIDALFCGAFHCAQKIKGKKRIASSIRQRSLYWVVYAGDVEDHDGGALVAASPTCATRGAISRFCSR
jgi:hypothetical protein